MNLVDANVLLYAVNADAPRHDVAKRWLDDSLSGAGTVCFSWIVLLAFVRLSTKATLFPAPLTTGGAFDIVDAWLARPTARIVEPTARHADIVRSLLSAAGTAGNLVNDAHLAALAIEHRATVVTFDTDFARFPGVDWRIPA